MAGRIEEIGAGALRTGRGGGEKAGSLTGGRTATGAKSRADGSGDTMPEGSRLDMEERPPIGSRPAKASRGAERGSGWAGLGGGDAGSAATSSEMIRRMEARISSMDGSLALALTDMRFFPIAQTAPLADVRPRIARITR